MGQRGCRGVAARVDQRMAGPRMACPRREMGGFCFVQVSRTRRRERTRIVENRATRHRFVRSPWTIWGLFGYLPDL
jgi:hypothetical protein